MQKVAFRMEIFREDGVYVGLCPELNVSSFGQTVEEAKSSLVEAVEAFIKECENMGTLEEVMMEAGFVKDKNIWVHRKPVVEELLDIVDSLVHPKTALVTHGVPFRRKPESSSDTFIFWIPTFVGMVSEHSNEALDALH